MKTDVVRTAKIRLQRMSLIQSGDDSIFLNGKKLPLSEVARYRQLIAEVLADPAVAKAHLACQVAA